MTRRKSTAGKAVRIGKLEPMYRFILNPFDDARFTSCPKCEKKMASRKLPLVIHIDPMQIMTLNKTCRYCAGCDLVIAHQNDIEHELATFFGVHKPEILGNDYFILGTVSRQVWKAGLSKTKSPGELFDEMHDWKEVLTITASPRWGPA